MVTKGCGFLREYGTFGQVEVPETIFEKTFSGCFCSNSFEYGLESIVAEPNLFVVGRSNGKCLNVFFASGSASPAFALVSLALPLPVHLQNINMI